MANDLLGNRVDIWDIIAVVSAGGSFELALVVDFTSNDLPVIIRYNADGTLRKRSHVFADSTERLVLAFDTVPVDYLLTRKAMIDAKG